MQDLFELPHSETEKYYVFFDNVTGSATMVILITKDNSPIEEGTPLKTCMIAFIDQPVGEARFSWNNDITLPEPPFTKEWALQEYHRHRKNEFEKI